MDKAHAGDGETSEGEPVREEACPGRANYQR